MFPSRRVYVHHAPSDITMSTLYIFIIYYFNAYMFHLPSNLIEDYL